MRFSYAESLCDVTHYVSLAQAAEEAGWHSMVVPASVAYPRDSDSKYPYNGTGEREFLDDQPFIDLAVAHGALLLSKDAQVLGTARRVALLGARVARHWPPA